MIRSPRAAHPGRRAALQAGRRRPSPRPRGLEFDGKQYEQINAYCREKGMPWFASCWDEAALDFIDVYDPPCYKFASASLTDDAILRRNRSKGKPIMLSTGMISHDEIHHAVQVLGKDDLILLHACSTYPAYCEELNLRVIPVLEQQYGVLVACSGHETGIASSVAAAAIWACLREACRAGCLPTAYPSNGRWRGSTAANPSAHGGHDCGLRWQAPWQSGTLACTLESRGCDSCRLGSVVDDQTFSGERHRTRTLEKGSI